jgi:hypothetical protein
VLEKNVGKIKNIKYDPETDSLEVLVSITDDKFKKKLLRDLSLSGKIKFKGDQIVYTGNKRGSING